MEKKSEKEKKEGRKVKIIVMNAIRLLLVIAFISAFGSGRKLVLFMSVFALLVTFLPEMITKMFKVKVPASFELILIFFIYGLLLLGKVRGFFEVFGFFSILMNMTSAVALGFVGLAVMYTLYKDEKINTSPLIISIFSFCFAVAVGLIWEMFEFLIDKSFGFSLQEISLNALMSEITANIAGALIVSFAGYVYIKKGKISLISNLVSNLVEKNPRIFKSSRKLSDSREKILDLIKEGESKNLEFKSTLRTNLFTNQIDRKIEHGSLKTVAAYLNTDGGTLLVGVDNNGEILGVEKDNFPSKDKLSLHFTNLIKEHIGAEYLPFIQFDLVELEGKNILKVDCSKSKKHVFLKNGKEEEFYIRNGPSSAMLSGSALIEYINHNFKKF